MKLERRKARDGSLERDSIIREPAHTRTGSPTLRAHLPKFLVVLGLLAAGAPFAFADPTDLKTVAPRPITNTKHEASQDARIERVDDPVGDAVERKLEEHAKLLAENPGKTVVQVDKALADANTKRNDTEKKPEVEQTARADAHLARVRDSKGDKEERALQEERELRVRMWELATGKFPKATGEPGIASARVDPDQFKKKDQVDKEKAEVKEQTIKERFDEKKDDAEIRKAEAIAEKARDRAEDRRERRDEARQEKAADRTVAKPGAGGGTGGP